jgi:hypothetical protein
MVNDDSRAEVPACSSPKLIVVDVLIMFEVKFPGINKS